MISYFDLHCDTAGLAYNRNEGLQKNTLAVDLNRMSSFNAAAFFAVYVSEDRPRPFKYASDVISFIHRQTDGQNNVRLFKTPSEYLAASPSLISPLTSILISIEGGDALESDLSNIEKFKSMGVSMLTLTWNGENALGSGCMCPPTNGLTPLGKRAIAELEKHSVIIDVSHLNERGFDDLHAIARRPYMASHSNAYAIHPHARNLRDRQIKSIAESGGIIGLNIYSDFIGGNSARQPLSALMRHATHIAETAKTTGCLAIGTDFDGMTQPVLEMDDITGIHALNRALESVFGKAAAQDILYRNVQKFFDRYGRTA